MSQNIPTWVLELEQQDKLWTENICPNYGSLILDKNETCDEIIWTCKCDKVNDWIKALIIISLYCSLMWILFRKGMNNNDQ